MSTVAPAVDDTHPASTESGHDSYHPTDIQYVRVAILLGVITGAEVAFTYIGLPGWVEAAGLLVMMALKFSIVASQFMHLKFDPKVLTRLFYAGVFLAVFVYVVALSTFRIFA